jgi:hypothetical protein
MSRFSREKSVEVDPILTEGAIENKLDFLTMISSDILHNEYVNKSMKYTA